MHPAPSLLEAPPLRDDSRPGPERSLSAGSTDLDPHHTPSTSASPPLRKDTLSSISTTVSTGTANVPAVDTLGDSPYGIEAASPTFSPQPIFSIMDGADMGNSRRPTRRRTGPLSASQREKAALIRKLGACSDCRRRRVACHPNHHNMTWEDAVKKYKPHSPTQEYAPLAGRPISPTSGAPGSFTNDDMDVDTTPTPTTPHRAQQMHLQHPAPQQELPSHIPGPKSQPPPPLPPPSSGRLSFGSEERLRTPLPSGRSLEKLASAILPGVDSLSGDLQTATAHVINSANSSRSRYDSVYVMLLQWSNEPDDGVRTAVKDLAEVLEKKYNYAVEIVNIPAGAQSPYRWLLQTVTQFINNRDLRESLKIVYYAGCSYLDGEREMVLSSPATGVFTPAPAIRWGGIQQVLEDAVSDTLVIMDAAYYPCSKMSRQEGVFELIAASAGEESSKVLGRTAFTQALIEELRTRLTQKFRGPLSALSAAELHVRLLTAYPRIIHDRNPEQEYVMSFPSPLHIQVSANARLPSIFLAPCRRALPASPESQAPGTQVILTVRLDDSGVDKASWLEWMRLLPEGVRDVKCERPLRNTFR